MIYMSLYDFQKDPCDFKRGEFIYVKDAFEMA